MVIKRREVLLAYSGGIDSHYAARVLMEQGYKVTAMMLDMLGSESLVERAKARCKEIGVDFISVDASEVFEERVIKYFAEEYIAGRTPAPCTVCNLEVKWRFLHEKAKEMEIEHIATGHYFGVEQHNGKHYLVQAKDRAKDQSYYLWMLPQEILAKAITPMKDVIKSEIMSSLPKDSLSSESMGVCFLEGGDYADFLKLNYADSIEQGEIVDNRGRVIGCHNGVALYTIGQKRGVEIEGNSDGLAVVEIDAKHNRIKVDSDQMLWKKNLLISNIVTPDVEELLERDDIWVKVRGLGRNPEGFCRISRKDETLLHIELQSPAWALAKGQPVVLYCGARVVGGGFLEDSY